MASEMEDGKRNGRWQAKWMMASEMERIEKEINRRKEFKVLAERMSI